MNFDKLPNEIKRIIFDRNREAAKDKRYEQNFQMVQVELKMLFQDEEYPWCEVKPSEISTWKDKEPDDQLEMYYYLANCKILPVEKFVHNHMTGLCDGDTETALQEVTEWDRDKELNNQAHQWRWPPGLLCKDRGSNDHIFCGHSEYESNCKCWFRD